MRKNEKAFFDLVNRGVYKIYKNGNIYRCKRKIRCRNEYRDHKPRLINQMDRDNYIKIVFGYNGKIINIYAHRVILLYFNGDIPKGFESNHKNNIKNSNRLSNLEVVTRSENMLHAYKNDLVNQYS